MIRNFNMADLVNAQIEISRALFVANAQNNPDTARHLDDVSDEKVLTHIKLATKHLQDAAK